MGGLGGGRDALRSANVCTASASSADRASGGVAVANIGGDGGEDTDGGGGLGMGGGGLGMGGGGGRCGLRPTGGQGGGGLGGGGDTFK